MRRVEALAKQLRPEDCAGEVVVTLIAGGNSGHVCAALIDGNTEGRVKVQLLTSRPELFRSLRPKAGSLGP